MKLIPAGATRSVGRLILKTKKNSPHIFFAAGVVGAVGSTILACKATLKLEETLDEIQEDMEYVKGLEEREILTPDQNSKNTGMVYGKAVGKMVRLYGPSAALGVVSIACLAGSHRQLVRRNRDLTIALAAMTKAFQAYRERVAEELGPEREALIHQGYVNTKPGAKGGPVLRDPEAVNPYRFIFDKDTSDEFEPNGEMNRVFLEAQQEWWQKKLRTRGYVFLNEVLHSIGMQATGLSGIVGWVWNGEGDNHIDFGIYSEGVNVLVFEGEADNIYLNFNCDGPIWDKI